MKARPYQVHAIERAIEELQDNQSTLIVSPTGTGKTVLFSLLSQHFMQHGRVMVIAHREELIRQAANKITAITGYRPAVEMAGEYSDENGFSKPRVVVSSVQTLCNGRVNRFDPSEFSLLITDECHHGTSDSYRKVYAHMLSKGCKHLGVTATPDRTDEAALGEIFQTVAFDYELPNAIDDGWLVPIHQHLVHVHGLDYSRAKTTAGDINQGDVAAAQSSEKILHEMIDPIVAFAKGRKTIVFATPGSKKPSDDSEGFHIAERMTEIFNRYLPNSARRVSQDTDKMERRKILDDYAGGAFPFLVNVGVLTEGFDDPSIEIVAITRPTKSRSLYCQMIGRGTRPLPGLVDPYEHSTERRHSIKGSPKPHVDVLDFVGNSGQHKLITTTDILGGKYSDDVVERAKKKIEKAEGSVDVDQALKDAKEDIRQERERKLRDAVVAKAKYELQRIDPFDVFDIEPMREKPWDKGKAPTDGQIMALKRLGIVLPAGTSRSRAGQLISEAYRRRDEGLVSYSQIAGGASPNASIKDLASSKFKAWKDRFNSVYSS